jgi:hypothetical protein
MMLPVANHLSRGFTKFALLAPLALLLAGCEPGGASAPKTRQAAEPPAQPREDPPAYAFSYPDQPPVVDAKGLQAFAARFRPRVVLLDFWASWCRQSCDELPDLIRLQEELGTDEFQVISCNLNPADHWSPEVVPLLRARHANFPCVVVRPEAKSALRAWLAPNWSYDLPARFIINPQGRIVCQALSDVSVADVRDLARRSLTSGGGAQILSADAVTLRLKLIDVRRGQAQSLPEVTAATADPQRLATEACRQLAPEIDRRLNARIAVLPFPSSRDRAQVSPFGQETAEQIQQELRRQGYYDLVGPEQTEKMVSALGLSALSIDFDPAVVKERLNCDFLILGWLRGVARASQVQPESAAESSPGDQSDSAVVEHPDPRE